MIKIGLVGEDPNDTMAIKNLLLQKFAGRISFIQLIKNKKGYHLDNDRTLHALKIEYNEKQPNLVLFIRDADAIFGETEKIKEKEIWFEKMLPAVNHKGMLLLNIYELEALILADINTFNKLFQVNIIYKRNVMFYKEPKDFLMEKTRRSQRTYAESDCPEIFMKLSFDMVCKNCTYFSDFYTTFQQAIVKL